MLCMTRLEPVTVHASFLDSTEAVADQPAAANTVSEPGSSRPRDKSVGPTATGQRSESGRPFAYTGPLIDRSGVGDSRNPSSFRMMWIGIAEKGDALSLARKSSKLEVVAESHPEAASRDGLLFGDATLPNHSPSSHLRGWGKPPRARTMIPDLAQPAEGRIGIGRHRTPWFGDVPWGRFWTTTRNLPSTLKALRPYGAASPAISTLLRSDSSIFSIFGKRLPVLSNRSSLVRREFLAKCSSPN